MQFNVPLSTHPRFHSAFSIWTRPVALATLALGLVWSWPSVSKGAQASDPYFDIQCQFLPASKAAGECSAQFRLCAQGSGNGCQDQGAASCDLPDFQTHYEGEFARATSGNEVILTAMDQVPGEPSPVVLMGPAKTPPRPGRPVVADSRLDYGDFHFQGECAVRLVR